MGRVSITLDTLASRKAAATGEVNERFNNQAATNMQRDAAHASKRLIAAAVAVGGAPTVEFSAEATLRGITPSDLAALILAKPDVAAQRELARQKTLLKIDQAATKQELDAISTNVQA